MDAHSRITFYWTFPTERIKIGSQDGSPPLSLLSFTTSPARPQDQKFYDPLPVLMQNVPTLPTATHQLNYFFIFSLPLLGATSTSVLCCCIHVFVKVKWYFVLKLKFLWNLSHLSSYHNVRRELDPPEGRQEAEGELLQIWMRLNTMDPQGRQHDGLEHFGAGGFSCLGESEGRRWSHAAQPSSQVFTETCNQKQDEVSWYLQNKRHVQVGIYYSHKNSRLWWPGHWYRNRKKSWRCNQSKLVLS